MHAAEKLAALVAADREDILAFAKTVRHKSAERAKDDLFVFILASGILNGDAAIKVAEYVIDVERGLHQG